ncbi:hypothetical protein [Pendulispora albinea]|uniref:Uncharacterized protein n=1 Tax=Pendulispora albinea TaxID=2741071 RepID=A0ABZ2M0J1_9BACT
MDAAYREELDYLKAYAGQDWLGFGPIAGAAAKLLRGRWTQDAENELMLRLVADLLAAGVRAGELTSSDETPFEPWPGDAAAVLDRIARELKARADSPDTGDICWFTVLQPRSG